MLSKSVPDKLKETPQVSRFLEVLDKLQGYKSSVISEALRVNNPGVCMDRKWILKTLEELGVKGLPIDYPIQPLLQLVLNADAVFRTRGSKEGIKLYCSVLSLGEVEIDDSEFYVDPTIILLDSLVQGYATGDNESKTFHVVSDTSNINLPTKLRITVRSAFFNGTSPKEASLIKSYLEQTIDKQLPFNPNKEITFVYEEYPRFYYHKLLNNYFHE